MTVSRFNLLKIVFSYRNHEGARNNRKLARICPFITRKKKQAVKYVLVFQQNIYFESNKVE